MSNVVRIISTVEDGLPTRMTLMLGASVKMMECKYGCGGRIVVTTMTRKPPHHLQCAIEYSMETVKQMHNKSGPIYDKWLDGYERGITRMTQGAQIWLDAQRRQAP